MKTYSGIFVVGGGIRRATLEAETLEEAQAIGAKWGVGIEGETAELDAQKATPPPEAYDLPTARRLLGNVSRTTVYNELAVGRLERVPHTRKVLLTRKSVEAWAKSKSSISFRRNHTAEG